MRVPAKFYANPKLLSLGGWKHTELGWSALGRAGQAAELAGGLAGGLAAAAGMGMLRHQPSLQLNASRHWYARSGLCMCSAAGCVPPCSGWRATGCEWRLGCCCKPAVECGDPAMRAGQAGAGT